MRRVPIDYIFIKFGSVDEVDERAVEIFPDKYFNSRIYFLNPNSVDISPSPPKPVTHLDNFEDILFGTIDSN